MNKNRDKKRMAGKSLRHVWNVGGSKVVTLPADYREVSVGERVVMLYDKFILLVPEKYAGEIEEIVKKAMLTSFNILKKESEDKASDSC